MTTEAVARSHFNEFRKHAPAIPRRETPPFNLVRVGLNYRF
jgi:hypothetical protein